TPQRPRVAAEVVGRGRELVLSCDQMNAGGAEEAERRIPEYLSRDVAGHLPSGGRLRRAREAGRAPAESLSASLLSPGLSPGLSPLAAVAKGRWTGSDGADAPRSSTRTGPNAGSWRKQAFVDEEPTRSRRRDPPRSRPGASDMTFRADFSYETRPVRVVFRPG